MKDIKEIRFCRECGTSFNVEKHHIIYRSEVKALKNCKLNYAYLCPIDHRGTFGPHGSKGAKRNRKYKLEFQNNLEMLLDKPYLTREEIKEVLDIPDKPLNSLLKTVERHKDKYVREEVIRACMAGKLIIEEDNNEKVEVQSVG